MYLTSILWYLSWPVLIAGSTLLILVVVRKFEKRHQRPTEEE